MSPEEIAAISAAIVAVLTTVAKLWCTSSNSAAVERSRKAPSIKW